MPKIEHKGHIYSYFNYSNYFISLREISSLINHISLVRAHTLFSGR